MAVWTAGARAVKWVGAMVELTAATKAVKKVVAWAGAWGNMSVATKAV